MLPPLSERARGRWTGLLPMLGVDSRYLSGRKNGPCPICGGKTRFRYDDKEGRGTWICNHCGAGDGADLAMKVLGIDFKELAERIGPLIGQVKPTAPRKERGEADTRKSLEALWRASKRVERGDAVSRYLSARVGLVGVPDCLRMVERLRYQDDNPSFHPGMIAKVTGLDGQGVNIHRTYLTADGRKADVESPRRMMQGTVPDGSAVRLFPPGTVLGIAEGIETAFAAASLFGVPVWAALNSTMLVKWEPPAGVEEVVVFGDADVKFAGQAAAFTLAKRLQRPLFDGRVRVEIPDTLGSDWCDVFNAGRRQAA